MSTEEALILVHGEMATIRDGEVTHQCIQTNLADVICGGNYFDKKWKFFEMRTYEIFSQCKIRKIKNKKRNEKNKEKRNL